MNRKRLVKALKVVRDEVPQYFEEAIMSDCPCDLGLPASMRKWCGMEETKFEPTMEYCWKCWVDALGEDDG